MLKFTLFESGKSRRCIKVAKQMRTNHFSMKRSKTSDNAKWN